MKHILIADDDLDVLLVLHDRLEHMGYQVTSVTSGEEAVEELNRGDYALILVCSELVQDGNNILRRMRQRKNSLPIIFMTSTDNKTTATLPDDGGQVCLRTPINHNDLKAVVERFLG